MEEPRYAAIRLPARRHHLLRLRESLGYGTGTSDHQPAAAALADEVPPCVSTVVVFGMEDHAGVPVELATCDGIVLADVAGIVVAHPDPLPSIRFPRVVGLDYDRGARGESVRPAFQYEPAE